MFQSGEILILLLLALIVLGPTRLPEIARKLGKWTVELRAAAQEITQGLQAEVADLKKVGEELKAPLQELKEPLKDLERDVREADPRRYEWKGPKPVSGPTPEDAMRELEEIEKRALAGEQDEELEEERPEEPGDEV